ncbi:MAG: hypothetical protein WD335_02355 [Candidatus Paceibacterota bacterium]
MPEEKDESLIDDLKEPEEAYDEEAHNYLHNLEHRVADLMHDIPESVHEVFRRHRRTAFEKHPFFFSTLGLFGLVATWQGFADVIQQIDFFKDNPGLLLIIGLAVLLFTGRLYRQMDQ